MVVLLYTDREPHAMHTYILPGYEDRYPALVTLDRFGDRHLPPSPELAKLAGEASLKRKVNKE